MSDHYVCLIPATPEFIPSKASQTAAIALIQKAWHQNVPVITLETDEHIAFRDCGENFESIHCPHCSTEVQVEYWQDLMDQDYSNEDGFRLRTISMPCCGHISTLNDFRYKWPMGFSRFIIRFSDLGHEISDHLLIELESVIGCKLRVIHQMY